jgi:hypothetical protein
MADSSIDITAGTGTAIDTRTESTNGNHRQVVILGDPSTNAGVAPVDATNGLAVDPKTLPPGAATSTKQDTIIGHVDGIEALLTTIDADTGSMATSLTSIAAEDFATETTLAAIENNTDGIEALLTTIDADTGNIASDTSSIKTSVQLIDDTVGTDTVLAPTKGLVIGGHASGAGTQYNIVHVSNGGAMKVDLNGALANLESYTDGIEGLLTTIDADTGTIAGAVSGSEMQVDVVTSALPSGASTSANQTTIIGHLDGVEGLLTTIDADTGNIASDTAAIKTAVEILDNAISGSEMQVDVVTMPAVTVNGFDVVDFIDTTPVLDTSGTNIPASSSNPVAVVASLAANVKKLKVNDTTGYYIGVYTGAALSEVLQCIIGPGEDGTIDVAMSSGERVSLRAMANTAISVGELAIQFIG